MNETQWDEIELDILLENKYKFYADIESEKNDTRPTIEFFISKMGQHNWYVNPKGETIIYQNKKQWQAYLDSKKDKE